MKTTTQFAAALWQPMDLIEIRSLPTDRGGMPQPTSSWVYAEDIIDMIPKLEKMNKAGHNHYVGILPRDKAGATKDLDCLPYNIIWADFDGEKDEDGNKLDFSAEKALQVLTDKNMPLPYMVVDSGHGTHIYWKIDRTVATYALAKLVHDIAIYLDCDPAVANPSRVMRLPGFDNLKKPVKPVEIISIHEDRIVEYDAFREIIPTADYYSGISMPEGFGEGFKPDRKRRDLIGRAEAYVSAFDTTTEPGRNTAAYSLSACLQKDFALDENEAWHIMQEWNNTKCVPPLTNNELYSCLQTGQRYGKHEKGCKAEQPEKQKKERPERIKPKKEPEVDKTNILDVIKEQIRQEVEGNRKAIPLPWKCLEDLPLLFPGKVGVLTGLPGASKSFGALNIGRMVKNAQLDWKYIPLEDDKAYHTRRLLSVIDGNWDLSSSSITKNVKKSRLKKTLRNIELSYEDIIDVWGACVYNNPALLPDGKMEAVDHEDALELIEGLCKTNRLVIIDPVAQIEFVGKNEWQVQASFMREVIGIANTSEATVLLVIHRAKRDNAGVYGVEGSKRFTDLAHTVLSFEHFQGECDVEVGDDIEEVDCNRIICVEKCRDSPLQGTEWAFDFGNSGPLFTPRGKVVKKRRRKT